MAPPSRGELIEAIYVMLRLSAASQNRSAVDARADRALHRAVDALTELLEHSRKDEKRMVMGSLVRAVSSGYRGYQNGVLDGSGLRQYLGEVLVEHGVEDPDLHVKTLMTNRQAIKIAGGPSDLAKRRVAAIFNVAWRTVHSRWVAFKKHHPHGADLNEITTRWFGTVPDVALAAELAVEALGGTGADAAELAQRVRERPLTF